MQTEPWTKADVTLLRRLAKGKHGSRNIARILGRSDGATRFKACKLGIRFCSIGRK